MPGNAGVTLAHLVSHLPPGNAGQGGHRAAVGIPGAGRRPAEPTFPGQRQRGLGLAAPPQGDGQQKPAGDEAWPQPTHLPHPGVPLRAVAGVEDEKPSVQNGLPRTIDPLVGDLSAWRGRPFSNERAAEPGALNLTEVAPGVARPHTEKEVSPQRGGQRPILTELRQGKSSPRNRRL